MREIHLDPPIVVAAKSGAGVTLATVDQVIDYVRQHDSGEANWRNLREAAFVAAAVPSDENIATLRALAAKAVETTG